MVVWVANVCTLSLFMLMICTGEDNANYSEKILRGNELPKFQADGLT